MKLYGIIGKWVCLTAVAAKVAGNVVYWYGGDLQTSVHAAELVAVAFLAGAVCRGPRSVIQIIEPFDRFRQTDPSETVTEPAGPVAVRS